MSDPDALAAAYEALGLAPGPSVVRTVADLRRFLGIDSEYGYGHESPRAVVMTMGALHEGHARLISGAREWVMTRYDLDEPGLAEVVVTIFVNPTQFGPGEDFHRYPRTFESDLELCRANGADVVFAPTPDQLYPDGTTSITIDPGPLGDELEGAVRPGHFRGRAHGRAQAAHDDRARRRATSARRTTSSSRSCGGWCATWTSPSTSSACPRCARTERVWRCRAATGTSTRSSTSRRGHWPSCSRWVRRRSRPGVPCPPSSTSSATTSRRPRGSTPSTTSALRGPDLGPAPAAGEARLLVAARIGGVRLIDNVMVMIGESA